MKRLSIISSVVIMLLVLIMSVSVPVAADPGVVGRVTVPTNYTTPSFSGDLTLYSNGTIEGEWQWKVFNFNLRPVIFRCNNITSLDFPDEYTATFSGTFTCRDMPFSLMSQEGISCELYFVLTDIESVVWSEDNPSGLPVTLPPSVYFPSGSVPDTGSDTLLVYCENDRLIAVQQGSYQIDAY